MRGWIPGGYAPSQRPERSAPDPNASPAAPSLLPNNFDYIRIFAATQVMVFHAVHHLGISAPGWTALLGPFSGVPVFFVTSGFLITASYERSRSSRSYAERRARRIIPGLWGCLAVTALVLLLLGYPILTGHGMRWLLAQFAFLLYTPAFLRDFGFGSYNGSLWTIPVEIQFYVTVPILSWFLNRCGRRATVLGLLLVAAWVLALVIRLIFPSVTGMFEGQETLPAKLVRYAFISHYHLFLAGAACYYLALHSHRLLRGKLLSWVALLFAITTFGGTSTAAIMCAQAALAAATISAAYTFVRRNLLHATDISYGTYLYHGLVLNIFVELGAVGREIYLYAVMAISYLAGFLSWHLVERRFLARAAGRASGPEQPLDSAAGASRSRPVRAPSPGE
ncbi:acyltransferase family protein [Enterovirga aerilata]|uniref:Acyltransferase n=1 Tax=Enterovirga aerilata TaxID=2730920 RepID=A0A849I1N4_9HYPH|nr:acyltransferase [Enterovirga sp. DB1703]NNM71271.1 acyltransferase [Enterovirga sp. DB1703]